MDQYTVTFGQAVSIKVKVNYLPELKAQINGREHYLTEEDSINRCIIFESDPISATDFDKDFSVIIQNGEGENSSYIHVSVNDYLYAISQSSTDEKMVNLAKALYNYGVSAKEYML